MKSRKFCKILCLVLTLCLCMALLPAAVLAADDNMTGKTVVIYTGNIRGDIDIYPQIAALKASYESKGADVILADVGNYLQGTVYATYDSGKSIIELIAASGYDVVALGSHEFDFGTGTVGVEQHEVYYADDTLGKLLESASFEAVASNIDVITETETGENAINAFATSAVITTKTGRSIGFFGLTDTDTVNQVLESNLGGLIFNDAVVAAKSQIKVLADCSLIIGLSNAGVGNIDGAIMLDVDSLAGFAVSAAVIDNATGELESNDAVILGESDTAIKSAVTALKTIVDEEYPAVSVAKSNVTLNGSMTASRSVETNTGDFWTDALLWFATEGGIEKYYDEDDIAIGNTGIAVDNDKIVAVWNGGNLRDYLNKGDVTIKDLKRVLPYPNTVAVVYLTGAQLLELLESATQGLPYTPASSSACASFPQVAGIKYTVDISQKYDAGEAYGKNWFVADSINRVTIESINGQAFDISATYAVITSNAIANGMDSNYICTEKDPDLSTITSAGVTDVVWMYINEKLNGVIGEEYAETQGRINIAPANITRGLFIKLLYDFAGSPDVEITAQFADVASDSQYAEAVAWAVGEGITNGKRLGVFDPEAEITREELAVFIYRYCGSPGVSGETPYTDFEAVASWAKDAVVYCYVNNFVQGESATIFAPESPVNLADGMAAAGKI